MENIAKKALLYDFYGPLLTKKQSNTWDLYYQQDYSLSEIAQEEGISRQAVHDLLKRTESILESYEDKLGLIKRFMMEKEKLLKIEPLLNLIDDNDFCSEEAVKRQKKIKLQIRDIIISTLEEL